MIIYLKIEVSLGKINEPIPHPPRNPPKLQQQELNKPSFENLLVEFRGLLKKPQTPAIKKKTNELRDLLYKQGTKAELKAAKLI